MRTQSPHPTAGPSTTSAYVTGLSSNESLRPNIPGGGWRSWHLSGKFSFELFGCARRGHVLVGTDAEVVREEDDLLVRAMGGLRWYRCLRCDSWLPEPVPPSPGRPYPPDRSNISLPLRGRPLRERYVVRLIALERSVHVLVLILLSVAVFVFAVEKSLLQSDFVRVANDLQGAAGGPVGATGGGIEAELTRLFAISTRNLYITAATAAAYALLEAVEAVGLWRGLRWAAYLTFVATALLIPFEVYELSQQVSLLKAFTLTVNLAVVVYLTVNKRLFGIHGGARAEDAIRQAAGWPAIERATPPPNGREVGRRARSSQSGRESNG
jgi:uncharacterized membrane protein (DUF2068 family)